jgi:serine protease DegS
MRVSRLVAFLFQVITAGLAAAFVVLYFYPGVFTPDTPVVEFREHTPATRLTPGDSAPVAALTGPISYAGAVDAAAPAVVNVFTQKRVTERAHPFLDDPFFRHFFGDRFGVPQERLETSLGSGVIASEQGYILTNNHVVTGADEIRVALRDGRSARAAVVGTDPDSDLAVLRIELADLPAITLGQSDTLRVGDVVLAIGNPFGVGQTVTSGIVSATGRKELGINVFENFIQTDAAINPGNSGGALVNAYGELVGINTAIFSRSGGSQGIGFAIPISLAKDVMAQIVEHGRVVRGWLGVEIQDLTPELAESFRLPSTAGAVVAGVLQDGPADRAGLERGDVITNIDERPVSSVRDALELITRAPPGTPITIAGVRGGEPFAVQAQVGERPASDR